MHKKERRQPQRASTIVAHVDSDWVTRRVKRHLTDLERTNYTEPTSGPSVFGQNEDGEEEKGAGASSAANDQGRTRKKSTTAVRQLLLYRKTLAALVDESNLAQAPKTQSNYLTAVAPPSKFPPLQLCSVCGYKGKYTCSRCGLKAEYGDLHLNSFPRDIYRSRPRLSITQPERMSETGPSSFVLTRTPSQTSSTLSDKFDRAFDTLLGEESSANLLLQRELAEARLAQQDLARELKALRASQASAASPTVEDQSSEVELFRQSLAVLASELETERARTAEHEAKAREEEDKVTLLRSKMEESRRALMRIQGESSRKNSAGELPSLATRRLSTGVYDSTPRRRSSLGLPQSALLGLGFGEPASLGLCASSSKVPLSRLAHRRGSASISYSPSSESSAEDDRVPRFRDLHLGTTVVKVASRRVATGNDFLGGTDLDFDAATFGERRRPNNIRIPEGRSYEGGDTSPPSAPLRWQGRRVSAAVFDDVSSRRSSLDSPSSTFPLVLGQQRTHSLDGRSSAEEDLLCQLEGLRIQLAESEEGRRASEHCLKAIKAFIASPTSALAESTLSLPPLPTDAEFDSKFSSSTTQQRASSSRWSLPRLSMGRNNSTSSVAPSLSSVSSPNLTTYIPPRRTSTASVSSNTTQLDKQPTPAASSTPIFGAFSFSNLVPRGPSSPMELEASLTMNASGESLSEFRDLPATSPAAELDEFDFSCTSDRAPSLTSDSSTSSRSSSPVEAESPIVLSADLVRICEGRGGGR